MPMMRYIVRILVNFSIMPGELCRKALMAAVINTGSYYRELVSNLDRLVPNNGHIKISASINYLIIRKIIMNSLSL